MDLNAILNKKKPKDDKARSITIKSQDQIASQYRPSDQLSDITIESAPSNNVDQKIEESPVENTKSLTGVVLVSQQQHISFDKQTLHKSEKTLLPEAVEEFEAKSLNKVHHAPIERLPIHVATRPSFTEKAPIAHRSSGVAESDLSTEELVIYKALLSIADPKTGLTPFFKLPDLSLKVSKSKTVVSATLTRMTNKGVIRFVPSDEEGMPKSTGRHAKTRYIVLDLSEDNPFL